MESTRNSALWCAGALAIAAALAGCPSTASEQEPAVFHEHQFLVTAKPTKGLGEDCSVGGASDCRKSAPVCWHFWDDPQGKGYACTKACETEEDCPEGWGCVGVAPGEGNSFCAPPRDWQPQAVAVRFASTSKGGAP